MVYARQSGQQYTTPFTTTCGIGARFTNAEADDALRAVIRSNPVSDERFTVEVWGATQQTVWLELTDLRGQLIHTRQVEVKTPIHQETLTLPGGKAGLYLLRVATLQQAVTIKVLKQ